MDVLLTFTGCFAVAFIFFSVKYFLENRRENQRMIYLLFDLKQPIEYLQYVNQLIIKHSKTNAKRNSLLLHKSTGLIYIGQFGEALDILNSINTKYLVNKTKRIYLYNLCLCYLFLEQLDKAEKAIKAYSDVVKATENVTIERLIAIQNFFLGEIEKSKTSFSSTLKDRLHKADDHDLEAVSSAIQEPALYNTKRSNFRALIYLLIAIVFVSLIVIFSIHNKKEKIEPIPPAEAEWSYSKPNFQISGYTSENIIVDDKHDVLTVYYYKFSEDQEFLRISIEQRYQDLFEEEKKKIRTDPFTVKDSAQTANTFIGSEKADVISYESEMNDKRYLHQKYYLEHNGELYIFHMQVIKEHLESLSILKEVIKGFNFLK